MKTRALLLAAVAVLLISFTVQAQMMGGTKMKSETKTTEQKTEQKAPLTPAQGQAIEKTSKTTAQGMDEERAAKTPMEAMSEQMHELMGRMQSMHSMMQETWPAKQGVTMPERQMLMMGMMEHMQDMGVQMQGMVGQMQKLMEDGEMMSNGDTKENVQQMQTSMATIANNLDNMTTYMEQMSTRYMPEKVVKDK
jgi:hypothetical protein